MSTVGDNEARTADDNGSFDRTRTSDEGGYRLLLPANFEADKKYPLILNLHGGAGVGDDNESNLRNWSVTFVDAAWHDAGCKTVPRRRGT